MAPRAHPHPWIIHVNARLLPIDVPVDNVNINVDMNILARGTVERRIREWRVGEWDLSAPFAQWRQTVVLRIAPSLSPARWGAMSLEIEGFIAGCRGCSTCSAASRCSRRGYHLWSGGRELRDGRK